MDDAVNGCMSEVSANTESAKYRMQCRLVYAGSTTVIVWMAHLKAELMRCVSPSDIAPIDIYSTALSHAPNRAMLAVLTYAR